MIAEALSLWYPAILEIVFDSRTPKSQWPNGSNHELTQSPSKRYRRPLSPSKSSQSRDVSLFSRSATTFQQFVAHSRGVIVNDLAPWITAIDISDPHFICLFLRMGANRAPGKLLGLLCEAMTKRSRALYDWMQTCRDAIFDAEGRTYALVPELRVALTNL